ncbi:MAG TPA: peptidoglycan DD-metalloendopeptidase family protein [Clostridia bacterium]|nr:peptidoglycan DD-metalloendopeptidase family protein [Clostridia bacterium]
MTRRWPKVDGRSKRQRYFTLLLIPHNEDSLRKWRIPVILIPLVAFFSLFGLGCMIFFAYGYFTYQEEVSSLRFLETINEYQARQIKELEQQAQDMERKLHRLDELDRQVRSMVGLEGPVEDTAAEGTGGGLEPLRLGGEQESFDPARWRDLEQRLTAVNTSRQAPRAAEENLQRVQQIAENYEALHERAEKKAIEMERLLVEVEERLEYLSTVPDLWPVEGRVTSTFGWRKNPITKRGQEYHEGIDIAARPGTPVKAAASGKVIFAGYRSGWGRVLVIDHGNGYQTQYAHNSSLLVKVGEEVEKGQIVARVGSTGRSTGSHLDFRILKDGQYIDPLTILKR